MMHSERPAFEVGDQVVGGSSIMQPYKGAKGKVCAVLPGTGLRGQTPVPGEKLEWSTPHEYVIDFGPQIGRQRILEGVLEPVTD